VLLLGRYIFGTFSDKRKLLHGNSSVAFHIYTTLNDYFTLNCFRAGMSKVWLLELGYTLISGGSRIWQGRVSNPSERGTGGGEATDMRAARRRQAWGPPTENLKIYILSDSFSRHFRTLQTVCDMI